MENIFAKALITGVMFFGFLIIYVFPVLGIIIAVIWSIKAKRTGKSLKKPIITMTLLEFLNFIIFVLISLEPSDSDGIFPYNVVWFDPLIFITTFWLVLPPMVVYFFPIAFLLIGVIWIRKKKEKGLRTPIITTIVLEIINTAAIIYIVQNDVLSYFGAR
ncbi:MAG: hypothetical protein GX800_12200 [Clostridiaceae bacterium]|nr:hypothetical protein [Clostridiaceae bacterium]